ncbi:MAG: hypothetical protein AB1861_26245, partial [Cyanobacteriota bacterium]
ATVYTHLWLSGKTLIDPPCIPALTRRFASKKGDFDFISPLFKGGWGDQTGTCKFNKTCVYTVGQRSGEHKLRGEKSCPSFGSQSEEREKIALGCDRLFRSRIAPVEGASTLAVSGKFATHQT